MGGGGGDGVEFKGHHLHACAADTLKVEVHENCKDNRKLSMVSVSHVCDGRRRMNGCGQEVFNSFR